MKKDFHTAYLDHIHGKTIVAYHAFSQPFRSADDSGPYSITGYGVIVGEYAMVSGGAGCGGHDVSHTLIVKLKSPADFTVVEVIACETDFL